MKLTRVVSPVFPEQALLPAEATQMPCLVFLSSPMRRMLGSLQHQLLTINQKMEHLFATCPSSKLEAMKGNVTSDIDCAAFCRDIEVLAA